MALLKELVSDKNAKELAILFNRTESAIRAKCNKLNLTLKKNKKIWTQEEVEFLRDSWGVLSISSICRQLNRSLKSIKSKANRIGLEPLRNSFDDDITITEFAEYMGISRYRIYYFHKRGLKMKRKKLSNKTSMYMISIKDALKFLEEHQNLFDAAKIDDCLFLPEPA